jgi:hypothetical protein
MFADIRWVGFHPPQQILYEKCKDEKFQVKMPENETLIKIGLFWNVDLTGKRGCTFEVKDGLATFQLSHKNLAGGSGAVVGP